MVCYFILRHICMIGSHRRVQRRGRKPEDSRPTRRRLGRGDRRSSNWNQRQHRRTGSTTEIPGDSTGEPGSPPEAPATAPVDRNHRRKRFQRAPSASDRNIRWRPEILAPDPAPPDSPPKSPCLCADLGLMPWNIPFIYPFAYFIPKLPLV